MEEEKQNGENKPEILTTGSTENVPVQHWKTKKKKIFCVTRNMAEGRGREEILRTTLIESIFYALFVLFATHYIYGVCSSDRYLLNRAIEQQFVVPPFNTRNDVAITFYDIRSAADFWFYVKEHMIGCIFWANRYADQWNSSLKDEMKILNENMVLGVPRLRQVKVRNNSCIVHEYFRRLFLNCYDFYSAAAEDREPFGAQTPEAWVFSDEEKTLSIPFKGRISEYGGGGYYTDFTTGFDSSKKLLLDLEDNLWITRGTRAIFLDFSVFNANINMFAICKLVFEFPATGGVVPSHKIHLVDLIRFDDTYDYVVFGYEIIFYCFIVFYIAVGIREIIYFKFSYFRLFWGYIDWAVITCSVWAAFISLSNLMLYPSAFKLIESNPEKYGNLEFFGVRQEIHNRLLGFTLFLLYIKVFKYLSFNKTMAQLNDTLAKCVWDILIFSIMFVVIFFAFAELGYLFFGSKVKNFSSFGVALFTLFRTILGDFDYKELERANRILAPIYFLAYIFLVFFVLVNLFLAIINDSYNEVKTENSIATREKNMREYLQTGFRQCLYRLNCHKILTKSVDEIEKNKLIKQIRGVLKSCGFSDYEIRKFFEKYNIDPSADVINKDIDRLKEDIDNLIEGDRNTPKKSYLQFEDFVMQQEKLEQMDGTIGILAEQVKLLLLKLDQMEDVKKMHENKL